ncbi:hypothetical protein B0H19DRAFT_1072055 [Mycena capillaripes]|nr:hypothetical protein B0H19DRAFT_1072055 [Mycena capillaripes]
MRVLHLFGLFSFASAKILLSYDASAGNPASVLGQQNLQGWDRARWPAGQKQNASAFFTTPTDPNGVPAAHVHKDAHFIRSEYHMLVEKTAADQTSFAAEADPSADDLLSQKTLWTKDVPHGTAYRFGIVINTSATGGIVQLYFNGKLSTMISPSTGEHTTKYSGNFFPGRSEPKVGLYGGQATNPCDSYIYNIVIGTTLADIADVADIST